MKVNIPPELKRSSGSAFKSVGGFGFGLIEAFAWEI